MKLLLTSAGLTSQPIADALFELSGKLASDLKVAYIPTAANIEGGDKGWVIDNLVQLQKQGVPFIDIIDISALSRDQWQPRLEAVDVLLFSGGNTLHLIHWMNESGLTKLLPELLKTRVYMGISAGSMATERELTIDAFSKLYFEAVDYEETEGLGFIDFAFFPHLNSIHFKEVKPYVEQILNANSPPLFYALDDHKAIKIDGDSFAFVGPGDYLTSKGKE